MGRGLEDDVLIDKTLAGCECFLLMKKSVLKFVDGRFKGSNVRESMCGAEARRVVRKCGVRLGGGTQVDEVGVLCVRKECDGALDESSTGKEE